MGVLIRNVFRRFKYLGNHYFAILINQKIVFFFNFSIITSYSLVLNFFFQSFSHILTIFKLQF